MSAATHLGHFVSFPGRAFPVQRGWTLCDSSVAGDDHSLELAQVTCSACRAFIRQDVGRAGGIAAVPLYVGREVAR